jgi:uncharacterized protein (DUF169 family)
MSESQPDIVDRPKASLAGRLKREFGGLWTGVALHDEVVAADTPAPAHAHASQEMRLCEAAARSFLQPIVLPAHKIGCPGARRALGLVDDDRALAERMSQKAGLPLDTLRKALAETPCLAAPVAAVSLGADHDAPDVVVGYVQPKEAMHVLRRWHVVYGDVPVVPLSSFLAICAWVVVRAHKLDEICVSLGCIDSRRFAGIGSDTMVVGMPAARAEQLVPR